MNSMKLFQTLMIPSRKMSFQKIYSLSSPIIKIIMLNLIVSLLLKILMYFHDKLNLNFQVFFPLEKFY